MQLLGVRRAPNGHWGAERAPNQRTAGAPSTAVCFIDRARRYRLACAEGYALTLRRRAPYIAPPFPRRGRRERGGEAEAEGAARAGRAATSWARGAPLDGGAREADRRHRRGGGGNRRRGRALSLLLGPQ